jgi:hypothetical protein
MSNLSYEPHRGRDLERERRYFNDHINNDDLSYEPHRGRDLERARRHFDDHVYNDEGHYHHHRYDRPLVVLDPPDGITAFKHQQSNDRARSQSVRRPGSESTHSRYSHSVSPVRATNHLGAPIPRKRSKNERAAEKAISATATAAFRVRNDPGHWAGEKGFKVAGAAAAAATVDALLGTDRHKHPLQHMAVAMVQGVVMDKIADSGLH